MSDMKLNKYLEKNGIFQIVAEQQTQHILNFYVQNLKAHLTETINTMTVFF